VQVGALNARMNFRNFQVYTKNGKHTAWKSFLFRWMKTNKISQISQVFTLYQHLRLSKMGKSCGEKLLCICHANHVFVG